MKIALRSDRDVAGFAGVDAMNLFQRHEASFLAAVVPRVPVAGSAAVSSAVLNFIFDTYCDSCNLDPRRYVRHTRRMKCAGVIILQWM
jgi:hypothetical protein